MIDIPVQRADAAPDQIGDPVLDAQAVVDDPSKKGSPEWLAAMQVIAGQAKTQPQPQPQQGNFVDLEKEMQALRGMSEI